MFWRPYKVSQVKREETRSFRLGASSLEHRHRIVFLRRVACASIHILIHDPASSFTISPARCPLSVCVSPFSHTSHARSPHVNMSDRAQTVHTLHTLGSSPRPSSVQACPPRHCRPVVSAEIKCAGRVMLSSAGTHRHHGAADLPPTSRAQRLRTGSEQGGGWIGIQRRSSFSSRASTLAPTTWGAHRGG